LTAGCKALIGRAREKRPARARQTLGVHVNGLRIGWDWHDVRHQSVLINANLVDRFAALDFNFSRDRVGRKGWLYRDQWREVFYHGRLEFLTGQGTFEKVVLMKDLMELVERIFAAAAGEAHSDMARTF
jgi:hypothetical protein